MRFSIISIISITGAILTSVVALHSKADGIRLGTPAYGGTGCPAGSASITLSPDETAISVLFDNFVAEAGGMTGKRVDRKSCNLTIPVSVPQGYSVAIFSVDFRGFNSIPYGGYSRLDAEYFWAGIRGPRTSETFYGGLNDNYIHSDSLIASSMVWSACGQSVNLRVNSSMMASTNSRREQILSTVDSVDLTSGMIYHIQWRRCY